MRALLLLSLLASPAVADEVWRSDMGEIIYDREANGAAIFTFTNVDGARAELVIPGLAGNYSARGTHQAFWLGEGAGVCDAFMALPDGGMTAQWGQALISFDSPGFPTSFTLALGWCFDPLSTSLRAEAY